MKYLLIISLIFAVISCSDSTENDSQEIIFGPESGTYDYYIGLSYSGDQSQYVAQNYFYVIIANETEEPIETVDLKIEDIDVDLEYANYDGRIFYIAYLFLPQNDIFNFEFTVNGQLTELEIPVTSKLDIELPDTLIPDEDVQLNWYCAEDPQTIYIEGFQWDANYNELQQEGDNLPSNARDYTIPADWLWSEENVEIRAIQVGIVNHSVVNRVAVTMSDGAYKEYVD